METITDNTIAEIDTAIVAESITPTEPTPATPVDVVALRAEIAADKASLADKERTLTAAELAQAETTHGELYAKCVEAQESFDEINRKVEAQTTVVYRSSTRRVSAAQQIDMHNHNRPQVNVRYGDKSHEVWQNDLQKFLQEQREAESEQAEVFAVLLKLQSERRQAVEELDSQSRPESIARNRVAQMTPRPAKTEWGEFQAPSLNGATLTFSSDNSLRSDPVTRQAATRGPADSQ
jgi:hypothetical protein